jgi:hypothetical protein
VESAQVTPIVLRAMFVKVGCALKIHFSAKVMQIALRVISAGMGSVLDWHA